MLFLKCPRILKQSSKCGRRACFYCQKNHPKQPSGSSLSQYYEPKGRVRNFALRKFFGFVQGYEDVLRKNFPRAFKIYQVFSIGVKEFYRDFKLYTSVAVQLLQGKKFHQLTLHEIETYHAMPQEIRRVAPTLIISALPLANYVIFPVAYAFPKKLLSSHFWSIQQKNDFALQDHRQRLRNYRPVFRQMQSKADAVVEPKLRDRCVKIFSKLGSGTHPTIAEIMAVKTAFTDAPFALRQLSFGHVSSLCRMHRLSTLGFRRSRLWYHAGILRQMDLAILRVGLQSLDAGQLRHACFLRGLNPTGLTSLEMLQWLKDWILITQGLDADNLSLLLHCPILLAYNAPTNWSLIH